MDLPVLREQPGVIAAMEERRQRRQRGLSHGAREHRHARDHTGREAPDAQRPQREQTADDHLVGVHVDHAQDRDRRHPGRESAVAGDDVRGVAGPQRARAERPRRQREIRGEAERVADGEPVDHREEPAAAGQQDDGAELLERAGGDVDRVADLHPL